MRATKNLSIKAVRTSANHDELLARRERLRQRAAAIAKERGFMDPEVQDLIDKITALNKQL